MLGAVFTSRDAVAGNDHVVVLSHDFWQRHLGRDPAAAGRALALNGEAYTIVGVMPVGFAYPPGSSQSADLWTLWVAASAGSCARRERCPFLGRASEHRTAESGCVVRAGPGADVAGRRDACRGQLPRPIPDARHRHSPASRSPRRHFYADEDAHAPGRRRHRATHRVRECREPVARACVGAAPRCGRPCGTRCQPRSTGPARADRESGRLGGWDDRRSRPGLVMRARAGDDDARQPGPCRHVGIDARVLAVAAAAALVTGLVSGLAPALQGSSPAPVTVLNESARGGGTSRGRRRARAVLVVAEVALAVVLLVGAALFVGSFINVLRIDPGFRTDDVLAAQLVQLPSPGTTQSDMRPALADIVARARKLPGVIDAAAAAPGVPFRINLQISALQAPGQPLDYNMTVSVKRVTDALPPDAGDSPQERPLLHGRRW